MLNTSESKLKNIGLQFFADPAPADPAPDPAKAREDPALEKTPEEIAAEAAEELRRVKAENIKLKAANDNLAKENAEKTKTIRSYKTTEEQKAEEAKEREAEKDRKIEEFEKRFKITDISKKVLTFVGDEKTADTVAEAIWKADDVDSAIDAFNKAWAAKEKALRLEFSKIPAPAGGDLYENKQKDVDEAHKFGKAKMDAMRPSNEGLKRFMK